MTDTTLQAREIAGIIERTCYERGGDIHAADDAAKQILDALTPSRVVIRAGDLSDEEAEAIRNAQPGRVEALTPEVSDEMVERVARAIEREFPECVDEGRMGFVLRLARAAIEAMR